VRKRSLTSLNYELSGRHQTSLEMVCPHLKSSEEMKLEIRGHKSPELIRNKYRSLQLIRNGKTSLEVAGIYHNLLEATSKA
jgi:hypothetical protein